MIKVHTKSIYNDDGLDAAFAPSPGGLLLLESGMADHILLETGGYIMLEK